MPLSFEHKPSLVAYLTCGDPDLAITRDIAFAAIDAGAAVIELGVPFSDPVADGPVIQRASERALRHGTSLLQVLGLAKEVRQHSQAGLIIFTYLNPILRLGMARFSAAAQDAGVDGALITDLPGIGWRTRAQATSRHSTWMRTSLSTSSTSSAPRR